MPPIEFDEEHFKYSRSICESVAAEIQSSLISSRNNEIRLSVYSGGKSHLNVILISVCITPKMCAI